MATQTQPVSYRDALDIVFAQRNRNYGAYALRREYPVNLGKALSVGLLLIGFFIILPHLLNAFSSLVPTAPHIDDRTVVLSQPPDIDPGNPPLPPPPPPATPPPPVRATIVFVPKVVQPDETVVEKEPPAIDVIINSSGCRGYSYHSWRSGRAASGY